MAPKLAPVVLSRSGEEPLFNEYLPDGNDRHLLEDTRPGRVSPHDGQNVDRDSWPRLPGAGESLRARGYDGSLTLIDDESHALRRPSLTSLSHLSMRLLGCGGQGPPHPAETQVQAR